MENKHPFGLDYAKSHLSSINQDDAIINKMLPWVQNPKNLFYFCGAVGNGKTYFAAAFYNFLVEKKQNVRVFTEQALFSRLMSCMNMKQDPHFELDNLCDSTFFILDDMGSSKPSEWKEEMLLTFLNHRVSNNLPTLITSNLNYGMLKDLYEPRFVSRIYAAKNTIIETNGPDRRLEI